MILLLAALLLLVGGPARAAVDDLPCVLCHPSRDRAAFELLGEMPGVGVRAESGQAFVCYSCHNGSVVDSRAALAAGVQHPQAFAPTRPLPKGSPLYAGRLDCGTCHSPHGKGAPPANWLRGGADGQGLCAGCHPDWAEPHVGSRLDAADQKAVRSQGGSVGAGGKVVCGTCHRLHGAQGKSLLIAAYGPGKESLCALCHREVGGASGGHPCSSCHDVHGPLFPSQPAARAAARCEVCHASRPDGHLSKVMSSEARAAVTNLGGRSSEGKIGCPTCHRIHGASSPRLLIAPYGPGRDELCRTCHGALAVKGRGAGQSPQPCSDCHRAHAVEPLFLAGEAAGPCARCHAGKAAGAGEHSSAGPVCATCHSIHHPLLPPASPGGLLRAPLAGGALCQPCHPGREQPHGPLSAVRPDARAVLAQRGLPTGPNGELECSTCHRVHGAKEPRLLAGSRLLSCLYCHRDQNPYGPEGPRPGVHPVGVYLRRSQRKALDAKADGGDVPDTLECSSCHPAHGTARSAPTCGACHPVEAAAETHGGVRSCGACHAVHGGEAPEASCARCHSALGKGPHPPGLAVPGQVLPAFDARGRRAGTGLFGCSSCHDPHGTGRRLLRSKDETELCLTCHPGKAEVSKGPHGGTFFGAGACAACHPAHGTVPAEGPDPQAARCRRCHGDDVKSLASHSPAGAPAWRQAQGALPLFDRSGGRNAYGFVTCPTCHDVHRPRGARALRREALDPPDLCLACHPEKRSLLGTGHDPRGTGGGAACSVCHPTHSRGREPPLWTLRSTAQGTWNDRMCSPCHGPPGDAPTRHAGPGAHPVNVSPADEVRPSGLPLYNPLGGKGGRLVACSTCHDIHGTPAPGGGALARYLRRPASTGELCAACHQGEAAVVGTPHDLAKTWPSATGPCGPCHAVHRGLAEPPLWGLSPGPSEYLPNAACRSCHRQGGPVRSEFLLLQYHMRDAEEIRSPRGSIYLQRPMTLLDEVSLRRGDAPVIPLFDRRGNAGTEGNLQCVSCHDPHRWSPLGAFVKPGFGAIAPNVPTHFLRLREAAAAEKSVCAVCHPKDAPERYQKYHQVWEELGGEFQ